MNRTRVIPVLLLALLALLPTSISRAAVPALPTDFPTFNVAFVGNTVVDLMWDEASGALSYRMERDRSGDVDLIPVTPEPINGRLFYRDQHQQAWGTVLSYRICAVFTSDETCTSWQGVTVGEIEGNLYKNLTWRDAVYQLKSTVVVGDGVVFRVTDGAQVSSLTPTFGLTSWGTGTLQVVRESGAPPHLIGITVIINGDGLCEIAGTESQLVILDTVDVQVMSRVDIDYVSAIGGTRLLFTGTADPSTVSHSSFDNAVIQLTGGRANIHHNTFECGNCIKLRDGADATIEDNYFDIYWQEDGIDIGASEAIIRRNTFEPDGHPSTELSTGAVLVWPDSGLLDEVTISDNTFLAEDPTDGVGVLLCEGDLFASDAPPAGQGPPAVTITGNTFIALDRGILVCDKVMATITENSLSNNGQAIGVASDFGEGHVNVTGNCIAGNLYGVYAPTGVDVNGNWWGSPVGPRTNTCSPQGAGDFITGGAGDLGPLTQNTCSAKVTNLTVHNIEAFQTVQTPGNTVPLVEGKLTAVRVYPSSSTGALSGVSGELVVRRGETELGTIQPYEPVDTIYLAPQCTTYYEYQLHSDRDRSLIYKLPAQWMSGTLTLAAEVNSTHSIGEYDYTDNTGVVTVTVQPAPRPVRIAMVPVNPGDLNPAELLATGELFRTLYPGFQVEASIMPSMQWTQGLPEPSLDPNSGREASLLLNTLGLSQMRLSAQGGWGGPAVDQMHAVIFPSALQHSWSEPTVVGGRGTAAYTAQDQVATAAALSLNLGRTPFPNCDWEIGTWGYNVVTDLPIHPSTRNAFCIPENFNDTGLYTAPFNPANYWGGPKEFQELLSYGTSTMAGVTSTAGPKTYVLVGGAVSNAGTVEFMPAWQVTATVAPLNPPVGTTYCLESLDAGDGVLANYCFDLAATDYWKRWQGFLVALPLSGSEARIALRQGATELGSITVSANAPSVTIAGATIARQASTAVLPISWSGQDSDGEDLVYSVLYSADNGASWLPVAANLTETHYDLDLGEVSGGVQAWVRVEVSDGFNTAVDTLGPFAVGDHDPTAAITHPKAGSTVSPTLTLVGYGYDQEDGELTGDALAWTSDRDGPLGTGTTVFVQDLVTGTHTLTLVATDTLGHTGTALILIGVSEPPTEETYTLYLPFVIRD